MRPNLNLTSTEKQQVILQGILKAGAVSIAFLVITFLFREFLATPTNIDWQTHIRRWVIDTPGMYRFITDCITMIYVLVLVGYTYWSSKEYINKKKQAHIFDYINYMAQGYYHERIPVDQAGDYKTIAMNINQLMDSIETSIADQKEAEKTKDQMVSNVSHDLRTPLTSILGFLELLKQSDLNEDQAHHVSVAWNKAKRMEVMVNDFFEYSQTQKTTTQVNQQDLPVAAFLEQVLAEFDLQANEHDIDLSSNVVPEDLVGHFDPDKMARVFGNLINNALKYGHGASRIQVSCCQVSHQDYIKTTRHPLNAKLRRKTNYIRTWLTFEVRNNGELIPEEELEQIFERSYRRDASRNHDIPGSGLGLSIVENLVHLHNGQTYASIDGSDLVFHVDTPQG